jgi:uncharacterized YccA/Bax inhibitor family protein
MQSSNPVFQRSEGFNGRGSTSGMSYPASGTQSAPGGPTYSTGAPAPTYVDRGRMTIDTVVQKTGITMAVVVIAAALTWILTGDITTATGEATGNAGQLMGLWIGGAMVGFALSIVLSFRKKISPPLVLAYALAEGVFIGAMSKWFETIWPGIVVGATLGTIAAVAGTLAAYKFFNISVSDKFRKWVVAAMFGFVAVSLLDLVLGFFSSSIGVNGFGGLGLLMSFVGLGLGVLLLILDFDFVERGIAAGLPEEESWRAAFGLTVTIIWIYVELLRIIAILRGD